MLSIFTRVGNIQYVALSHRTLQLEAISPHSNVPAFSTILCADGNRLCNSMRRLSTLPISRSCNSSMRAGSSPRSANNAIEREERADHYLRRIESDGDTHELRRLSRKFITRYSSITRL